MSNATRPPFDPEIQASKIPARNGYGQNGFQGPSSDCPGENTTSGLLPKVKLPTGNAQLRAVSSEQIAAAHGMRDRAAEPAVKIPAKTARR
jgi:hypothetical protein